MLFSDVVSSTAWRTAVGDRVADESFRIVDALTIQAVAACEGTIVKGLGDGVLATFPSASHAIAGAMAIQQALQREHRRQQSAQLEVRIGIGAGDVSAHDRDIHGLPVVEAARLCAAALGGQILCGAVVRLLGGSRVDAAFIHIGDLTLKGLAAPVETFEIDWRSAIRAAQPLPAQLSVEHQFPFVGRLGQNDLLLDSWRLATTGECQAVVVSGEPGVGKTRLVSEVARQLHGRSATVLFGRCDDGLGVPYQPFVEMLRWYLDHANEPETGRFGGDLIRLVPDLERYAQDLSTPLVSDPESEQYRLFEAVASWLSSVSATNPVLLFIDDIQWATRATLLLLRHLVSSGRDDRVLIVATYRDTDVDRGHPLAAVLADLQRLTNVQRVQLDGLDQREVVDFLAAAAGHHLDDNGLALASKMQTATGGNAFFVSELVRHLDESEAIFGSDERWTAHVIATDLQVPAGIRGVVTRRLMNLSETAREVLAVASAVGAEFDPFVVASAGQVDLAQLDQALVSAVQARLIDEVQGTTIRYRFAHALVRSTLYSGLSALRRIGLHRRVGEAIEARTSRSALGQSADLAFHYGRAAADGDVTKAIEWSIHAGDEARVRLAFDEAVDHYRQAVDFTDSAANAHDERYCDLLINLGTARWLTGDSSSRDSLLAAAELAGQLGDSPRQVRALLADNRGMPTAIGIADPERILAIESALAAVGPEPTGGRARLLSELGLNLIYEPNSYERRCELADEAVTMARQLGEPATLAATLHNAWVTIWAPGTVARRHRIYDELDQLDVYQRGSVAHALTLPRRILQAVELVDAAQAWRISGELDGLAADLGLPMVRWLAGVNRVGLLDIAFRLDEASAAAERARDFGRAAGQPDAELFYMTAMGSIASMNDQMEPVVKELGTLYELFPDVPGLRPFLAYSLARVGQFEEALTVAGDLLDAPHLMALDGTTLTGISLLAEMCNLMEYAEPAQRLLDLLEPLGDTIVGNGVNWDQPVSIRIGILNSLLGNWDASDRAFIAADVVCGRLGAPAWQALAKTERALMLLKRDWRDDKTLAASLLADSRALVKPYGGGFPLTRLEHVEAQMA